MKNENENIKNENENEAEKVRFDFYEYEGIKYSADSNLITNYLRVSNNLIGVFIKGQENAYALLDKEKQFVFFNNQIDKLTFGMSAEATRIKVCALLNTLYLVFVKEAKWQFGYSALGVIKCKESALDNRKKASVNIADLIKKPEAEAEAEAE